MLIIIITVLFCVAQNLMREASAFLLGMEPTAAILTLSTFVLICFARLVCRADRVAKGSVT
jgi:hypothetical protein